jgi:hypothetical protein
MPEVACPDPPPGRFLHAIRIVIPRENARSPDLQRTCRRKAGTAEPEERDGAIL